MYYRVKDRRPGPEVLQFPQAILDLAPEYVIVEDGRVDIGMYAGGFDHCGVLVYPEGFVEPYPGFKCGHRKLIDGLWYYDDEYNNDPEYDKVIDAWIKKGGNGGGIGSGGTFHKSDFGVLALALAPADESDVHERWGR